MEEKEARERVVVDAKDKLLRAIREEDRQQFTQDMTQIVVEYSNNTRKMDYFLPWSLACKVGRHIIGLLA